MGTCDDCDAWVEDSRKRSMGELPPTTGLDEIRREYAKLEALIKLQECTHQETWQTIPCAPSVAKELLRNGTSCEWHSVNAGQCLFSEGYCVGMYDYVLKNIQYLFKPSDQVAELKKAFMHIAVNWMRMAAEGEV